MRDTQHAQVRAAGQPALRYNLFVMPDEETTASEPEAPAAAESTSVATDRLAVVAATAAVSVAIGGALLELCYTLFRF